MLARIELDYTSNSAIKALSRENYAKLRESVVTLCLEEWPETKAEQPYRYGSDKLYIDMTTDGPVMVGLGIPFKIVNFKGAYMVNNTAGTTHSHIHIALPNIGLLMIDEVTWLDDACTQDLQRHLDDGWRILAVCPPNGVRRPDYILGRTKK